MFVVRAYGAKGDGRTPDTQAIQSAIDAAAQASGGRVYFAPGTYLTGGLALASGVTLDLEAGATVLGSGRIEDYSQEPPAVFYGRDLQDIAIVGRGRFDGQGASYRDIKQPRPFGIYLRGCRNVLLQDVTLCDAGQWMACFELCDGVVLRGLTVRNHVTYNNDGIDLVDSRNVRISDCHISTDDDAIVLKSRHPEGCENVAITNCVVSSHCNAIKLGTESYGGFRNITIGHCTIAPPEAQTVYYGRREGQAALAVETVDGGVLERVAMTGIVIRGSEAPIFIRLGNRARPYGNDKRRGVGRLRHVSLAQIVATGCGTVGCSITGLPGSDVEHVSLSDIQLEFQGGEPKEGERAVPETVPEHPEKYPASGMFGRLPAYGFFCRHVSGLTFNNVELLLKEKDPRPPLVYDDVKNLRLENVQAHSPAAAVHRLSVQSENRSP